MTQSPNYDRLIKRRYALHPRVNVGNCTQCWTKKRQTIYGATLDGSYHGKPRCRTYEGALRKAETLSAEISALDVIDRLGSVSIIHHATLGDLCGSAATNCAALVRLVARGDLDSETFVDAAEITRTIFARPSKLRVPAWAMGRLPPRYPKIVA